jgi:hypothetical protein
MNRPAELPGAVEAKRAERVKPDCGGAAEPEFGVRQASVQKKKPRATVAIFGGARTFLSAFFCALAGNGYEGYSGDRGAAGKREPRHDALRKQPGSVSLY